MCVKTAQQSMTGIRSGFDHFFGGGLFRKKKKKLSGKEDPKSKITTKKKKKLSRKDSLTGDRRESLTISRTGVALADDGL